MGDKQQCYAFGHSWLQGEWQLGPVAMEYYYTQFCDECETQRRRKYLTTRAGIIKEAKGWVYRYAEGFKTPGISHSERRIRSQQEILTRVINQTGRRRLKVV